MIKTKAYSHNDKIRTLLIEYTIKTHLIDYTIKTHVIDYAIRTQLIGHLYGTFNNLKTDGLYALRVTL
jgi:hypothetical protein